MSTGSIALDHPIDQKLFGLVCRAMVTALNYVREAGSGKTHVGDHANWPELRYHDNSGLPWVANYPVGPKNYGDAISGTYSLLSAPLGNEPALDFRKEANFVELAAYAKTHPRVREYLGLGHDIGDIRLLSLVSDILDRYVHRNGAIGLDPKALLPIYLPIEMCLFDRVLPVTVVVPILFLKFEFPNLRINDSMSIGKLSEEFHLARGWSGAYGDTSNSLVESAATHGLFISGIEIENENWLKLGQREMEPTSYPIEIIDTFFAALRIATAYPTGYAQIVSVPVNWADSYAAEITPVSGPRVEKYPFFFKEGYWQEPVASVTRSEAVKVAEVFVSLQRTLETADGGKVRVALHRLNLSATRVSEEDGIIDCVTAMEALLSDGTQEMTYKVAMRLGALYKILDSRRATQAFTEVKKIYAYRSKIVHGSADLEKGREIGRGEGKIATIDAAIEHLRNAFFVLVGNPAFLDPKEIDRFLLSDMVDAPLPGAG